MPEPRRHGGGAEHERLLACSRQVDDARARLTTARHEAARAWDINALRSELLQALEDYAAAITASGAPVPRLLRSEIDLYRGLGDGS